MPVQDLRDLILVCFNVSQDEIQLVKPIPINFKNSNEDAVEQIFQLHKVIKALQEYSMSILSSQRFRYNIKLAKESETPP